ncbi:DUF4132 domain-containing protein [Paraglaciecola aquimarina]|uniref:DUF4132 domain-containing protein n=1 Tax=Paraglaciecola algarum TaxID=3050085 RepID=A0ABS9D9T6_9ALTE|nr:DUF4132 domain-containing protein [Paraglaciecola sp. G1-23]MCF2949140.1 DUF4132 domain-containing protein [Paraglaciecola sp. G1-23]
MLNKLLKNIGILSASKKESQYDEMLLSIEKYILSSEKYIYAGTDLSFANCPQYQELKKLSSSEKLEVLDVLVHKISTVEFKDEVGLKSYYIDIHLLNKLLRFNLRFPNGYSFLGLFNQLYQPNKCFELPLHIPDRPFSHFVKQIEHHVSHYGLDPITSADIKALITHPKLSQYLTNDSSKAYWGPDIGKAVNKLETLLFLNDKQLATPYVLDDGRVSTILNMSLAELTFAEQNQWHVIFNHLSTASTSKPSKSFIKTAQLIIEQLGTSAYQTRVIEWITAISKLKFQTVAGAEFVEEKQVNLLKGMVWTLSLFQDEKTLQSIELLTEVCFKKIIGKGAASTSLGNAGIYVLAQANGMAGINYLSKLKLNIRQTNTQKLIQKYIEKKANSMGMSTARIEELSVPTFGLINGKLSIDFDYYQFQIALSNSGGLDTHWGNTDGKIQKTTPEWIKKNDVYMDKLKDTRSLCKQIKQTFSAQKHRIDRLYTENMQWTLSSFSKTYLQHGLLSQIANKLIWKVDDNLVIFVSNQWKNVQGQVIDFTGEETVELWHPHDTDNCVITQWRSQLQHLQIQQPIKQAFRECFHLSEFEISNQLTTDKLAKHILKQHQLKSLAVSKGWAFQLLVAMGDRSGKGHVSRSFPEHKLTVKLSVNEPSYSNTDINESWMWNYVVTDEVTFFNEEAGVVNFGDVPAILFSEIFRDISLFIEVASIGREPLWEDEKAEKLQGYKDYWHLYSFGELTETAKSRKNILERLIPHLTLGHHMSLDGSFLVISGKINNYKIHIGSAQILIQKNEQVLYFETQKTNIKSKDNIHSLFEIDSILLAILSKAHVLVDDDKIKYPSFLAQLSARG